MEIIHLILGKANPERMNGVNKVVDEMATKQQDAGETVEVWGITAQPVHDYPLRSYTTKLFKSSHNPFGLSNEIKRQIALKKNNTVFHLHGGFIPQMYSAAMWMKLMKIRFIITPHGSYNTIAMQKSKFFKKIYFYLFERKVLRTAHAIHSLGQSEINGLQAVFPNNKSVLIPYGFEAKDAIIPWKQTGEFIIGYCGRLDIFTKGLYELLEGFRAFNNEQPRARLWIIGDGKEREKLEDLVRKMDLQKEITFFGACYGEEKKCIVRRFNVLAVPSRNEGLPTVVLEAASIGIPCLVTQATNTGEYIRSYNAGFVMEQTDPIEIKNGLKMLYEVIHTEPGSNAMRANARRMVQEAFDWKIILDKFHKVYEL
jgi:glycosyltransferase involved in cell wall biosynthesis